MGQKCSYLAKNACFGPNMAIFGPKLHFLGGEGVKALVPLYQGTSETPLLCWKHWPVRLQLAAKDKNVQFWPQNLDIWGQKSISLFWNHDFCQQGTSPVFPGQQISHSDHPKKFCFWAMGYFPGLTPFFGHFEPFPLCYYKYPYFWTVVNETWWDRPCHKKMTHNDSGPGPGQNYGEKAVFTFVFTFVFLAKTLFFSFS